MLEEWDTSPLRPYGIVVLSDGSPWLTYYDTSFDDELGKVFTFDPSVGTPSLSDYTAPFPAQFRTIDHDADDILWIADKLNKIVSFNPTAEVFTDFPLDSTFGTNPSPYGVSVAPDGSVWFTCDNDFSLGRYEPASDTWQRFPAPGDDLPDSPVKIAFDASGYIWFTMRRGTRLSPGLGRLNPSTGDLRTWTAPELISPFGIAVVDGIVWLLDHHANLLVRFDPTSETFTHFHSTLPDLEDPHFFVVNLNGVFWLTAFVSGAIGTFDPVSETFESLPLADPNARPMGISRSPVGEIWWAEVSSTRHGGVGRFTRKAGIMQVLDRSGSMGEFASTESTDRKIEVLRSAAQHFIEMMRPDFGNQLGLVQFNQDVVPFDPIHEADLAELTDVRATLLRTTTVPSIVHGGSTSIGDGLRAALNQLTGPHANPDHDKVILLVSDGKENTPSWISNVQRDLIDNNVAVYSLGLGHGAGIREPRLTDLAEATGGTYRITSDDLVFHKFFIEILAGALDWSVVLDPIGELTADETVTIPVTVASDEISATFTAYWEGVDNAIDLDLITPSGMVITPKTKNSRIRYGQHARYAFYQLDYPLSETLASEWAGEWKMRLSGTGQIPNAQNVRYSASAFAEGGAKLNVTFDRLSHLTGDKVLVKARLSRGGKPLNGTKINVYCDVPTVGAGNILREGKVKRDELEEKREIYEDTIGLIDRKFQILAERAGEVILKRGKTSLELYDDGKHGDGKANDGLYANSFIDTKVPGSYTCRFVASNIPVGQKLTTTREWTKSFYIEANIAPKYSVIDIRALSKTKDGWRYSVEIVPRDEFGNYLGPGYPVLALISYPKGKRKIELTDNIDGTYTGEIFLTHKEIDAGAKLEIHVAGKGFAKVEQLPAH
jgi:streptogramin lyase